MKKILFNPHSSVDVNGLEFFQLDLPGAATANYLIENIDKYRKNSATISISDKEMQSDGSFIVTLAKSELNFNWNVIVCRSSESDNTKTNVQTYLSMFYWDSVVSQSESFEQLKISYMSSIRIKPESDIVSLSLCYINHTKAEATGEDAHEDQHWFAHPNLDISEYATVGSEEYYNRQKVYWSTSPIEKQTVKVESNSPLTGYTDNNIIKHNTSIDSTAKPYSYQCIPQFGTEIPENIQLLVSARFGVGLYDKTSGDIQYSKAKYQLCPAPDEKVIVYQYGTNVTLFYYPDEYKLKVSCRQVDKNNKVVWQTPWEVGSEERGTAGFKVVVPSYVDIIPFVFLYINGNWNIAAVQALSESYSSMIKLNNATQDANAYSSNVYIDEGSCPVEMFFSTKRYIRKYMHNATLGYVGTTLKDNICEYWLAQLYWSFQTFLQSIRISGTEVLPQIEDCGIRVGEFFIPYSQDAWHEVDKNSPSSNAIRINGLKSVDNFLAYDGSKIINMLSGSSIDVSKYTNVQMKHGVVIGFSEGKCEQLQ